MIKYLILIAGIGSTSLAFSQAIEIETLNSDQLVERVSSSIGSTNEIIQEKKLADPQDKIVVYQVSSEKGKPAFSEIVEPVSPVNQQEVEVQKISSIRPLIAPVLMENKNKQPK